MQKDNRESKPVDVTGVGASAVRVEKMWEKMVEK
jgi:hypothetical protein